MQVCKTNLMRGKCSFEYSTQDICKQCSLPLSSIGAPRFLPLVARFHSNISYVQLSLAADWKPHDSLAHWFQVAGPMHGFSLALKFTFNKKIIYKY